MLLYKKQLKYILYKKQLKKILYILYLAIFDLKFILIILILQNNFYLIKNN